MGLIATPILVRDLATASGIERRRSRIGGLPLMASLLVSRFLSRYRSRSSFTEVAHLAASALEFVYTPL